MSSPPRLLTVLAEIAAVGGFILALTLWRDSGGDDRPAPAKAAGEAASEHPVAPPKTLGEPTPAPAPSAARAVEPPAPRLADPVPVERRRDAAPPARPTQAECDANDRRFKANGNRYDDAAEAYLGLECLDLPGD